MVRRKKSIFNSEKKHRIVFDECLDLSKIICSYCLIKYVEVFHVIGKIFKKVFWSSHVKFGDNFYIYGSDKDPFQISRIDNCELKESEKLNLLTLRLAAWPLRGHTALSNFLEDILQPTKSKMSPTFKIQIMKDICKMHRKEPFLKY